MKLERINNVSLKIGGLIMSLSYLPQIFQVISTKSSEGINLLFITMVTIAISTFTFNGYVIYMKTGNKGTMLSQLANLIPAVILIICILIFR